MLIIEAAGRQMRVMLLHWKKTYIRPRKSLLFAPTPDERLFIVTPRPLLGRYERAIAVRYSVAVSSQALVYVRSK